MCTAQYNTTISYDIVMGVIILFMKSFKIVGALLFAVTFSICSANALLAVGNDVRLVVNGEELSNLPASPVIRNDFTLVPARHVFERVGAVVDWHAESRAVYVGFGDSLLVMYIDNPQANMDGRLIPMAVPPSIINNATMIPLRFVSESFGFDVGWDPAARVASVDSALPQPDLPLPAPKSTLPSTPVSTPAPPSAPSPAVVPARDVSTREIPFVSAPLTQISSIVFPDAQSPGAFLVRAASPITGVETILMEDNRLILDIQNAEMNLPQSHFAVNNAQVRQIRASQFEVEPVMVTRVVFDLQDGVEFRVDINDDRTAIIVDFGLNTMTDVRFQSDGGSDVVTLSFLNAPVVNVYPVIDPNRLIIDAPSTVAAQIWSQAQAGRFVSAIHVEQVHEGLARITMDLTDIAMFATTIDGNTVTVRLTEPTFRNIRYNAQTQVLQIAKNQAIPMHTDRWMAVDHYHESRYTIILPGDFSGLLGYGLFMLNDDFLRSVLIQNNANNQTELIISTNRTLTFDVTEDAAYIYIRAINPRERYDRIVVLDPGHGGTDPGAAHNGLREADVVLDITLRTIALLEQEGSVRVYSTRRSDVTMSLRQRVNFANPLADLFISIHNNAAPNTAARGIETYYYPHANDASAGLTNRRVADMIHASLVSTLDANDREVRQRQFYVIRHTTMPAALAEIGFLSNLEDAALLATDNYRQQAAQALAESIWAVFAAHPPQRP